MILGNEIVEKFFYRSIWQGTSFNIQGALANGLSEEMSK